MERRAFVCAFFVEFMLLGCGMTMGAGPQVDAARALEIARDTVAAIEPPGSRILLPDRTVERSFGWVFFYTTKRYLESKSPEDLVPGDGPLVVHRTDGSIAFLSTSLSPLAAVEQYETLWRARQAK